MKCCFNSSIGSIVDGLIIASKQYKQHPLFADFSSAFYTNKASGSVLKMKGSALVSKICAMPHAYLQNKKAKYYYISDNGTVQLTDQRKPLQYIPEIIDDTEGISSLSRQYDPSCQTGLIFRGEGMRILSHIFFRQGVTGDCVLTLESEETLCGDLDFSTARIYSTRKELTICCIHF